MNKNNVIDANTAIDLYFDVYRVKDEYYPLYLVPKQLFTNVITINYSQDEESDVNVVKHEETKIKKQCFSQVEYVQLKACNICDGTITTYICSMIQSKLKE